MDLYEKIKELAAQKNVSIRQIEDKLQFSNATIRRWKTQTPGVDKIQKVADYFHVSVDYLLGREEAPKEIKKKLDLEELAELDDDDINWDEWLSAGGKPLSSRDKATIKAIFGRRLID